MCDGANVEKGTNTDISPLERGGKANDIDLSCLEKPVKTLEPGAASQDVGV